KKIAIGVSGIGHYFYEWNTLPNCFNNSEIKQVYWLNKYGAWEQFCFAHNDIWSEKTDVKNYTKKRGQWMSSGLYGFDTVNSGDTSIVKNITRSGKLISNPLDEKTYKFVKNITHSPLVYI